MGAGTPMGGGANLRLGFISPPRAAPATSTSVSHARPLRSISLTAPRWAPACSTEIRTRCAASLTANANRAVWTSFSGSRLKCTCPTDVGCARSGPSREHQFGYSLSLSRIQNNLVSIKQRQCSWRRQMNSGKLGRCAIGNAVHILRIARRHEQPPSQCAREVGVG